MLIKTLVENTAISSAYRKRRGICLYIETRYHKILFDLGPDDTFLRNAEQMNVDIEAVDTVVISHGHIDHGGALRLFLERNHTATVYIHQRAFEAVYAPFFLFQRNVGLDQSLANHERLFYLNDTYCIDEELLIFTDDNASHPEQCLLVYESGMRVLFAGCAHTGILNLLELTEEYTPYLDYAITGFHLYDPRTRKGEELDSIMVIGEGLKKYATRFITGHCTGNDAFVILKTMMGDQIGSFSTGTVLQL